MRVPKKWYAFAILAPQLKSFSRIEICLLNLNSKPLPEFHCHRFHLIPPDPCLPSLQKAFRSFIIREFFQLKEENRCRCQKQFGMWPFLMIHSRGTSAADSKWPVFTQLRKRQRRFEISAWWL